MFRKLIPLIAAPALLAAQQMPAASVISDTAFHPISLAQALKLAHDNNVQNITSNNTIRIGEQLVRAVRARCSSQRSTSPQGRA